LRVDPPQSDYMLPHSSKIDPHAPMDEDTFCAQIEAALKTCEEWNGLLPMAEEVEKWAKSACLAKVSCPKHAKI
jgi:hypothetical protein